MTLKERINRWRQDFGYGVHSPLGYRIVKEVLNPPRGYAFYGYDRIDAMAAALPDPHMEKRARMLLRLGAEFQPALIWHSPGTPEIYVESLRLAGGIVRIFDGALFPDEMQKGELVLIVGSLPEGMEDVISRPDKILVCFDIGEDNVKKLTDMLKKGVMFDAVDSALIITGSGLSPMLYTVSKSLV